MAEYIIGDPNKPSAPPKGKIMSSQGFFPPSSQGTDARKLDIRDMIANFVNRQDKDLSDDQAKKDFKFMATQLGEPTARKILNHVLIFNQRPDIKTLPFERRLSSLYDIGSNDKDVNALLKRTAILEQGPIPGARTSSNIGLMTQMPIAPVSAGIAGIMRGK